MAMLDYLLWGISSRGLNPRLAAVRVLTQVLPPGGNGISLRAAIEPQRQRLSSAQHKGLMADICFGVCRHYDLLNYWLQEQLETPIKAKAWPVHMALLAGVYELWFTDRPAHAIVNTYPDVCRELRAKWAVGLSNALLRKAATVDMPTWRAALIPPIRYSLPGWLWQQWRRQWGEKQALTIAEASISQAPLTLRFNSLQHTLASALSALAEAGISATAGELSPQALYLHEAVNVAEIPGFEQGAFSVQDEAAQMPALLLEAPAQVHLLDACAAPGGKTGQIAEHFPQATITAIDSEASRLPRIHDNLARLNARATVFCADARQPNLWHQGPKVYAMLLDAPWSAIGILRRQPDVKWHQRHTDLPALVALQAEILTAHWPLLAPEGVLVYATCSILQQENALQIQHFLDQLPEAQEDTPQQLNQAGASVGAQLLPQVGRHDGFYLARLRKPQ